MFRTIQSAALTIAMLAAFTLSAAAHDHAQPVENAIILGDLTLSGPFARATLPNAPVGGGYLTITNNGAENDTLISAKSAAAGAVQLHNMEMQNNVMRMFEMKNGIPIPAGETVTLMPGGGGR